MFYKGIIFDLDNTLYNYEFCHANAISSVFLFLKQTYPSVSNILPHYEKIAKNLKKELINTASCHNKSIYFKQLLEQLNLGLESFSTVHELYWTSFFEKIECYDGVKEFVQWNASQNIKIAVLTDYETEYQIVKLEKLGLLPYINIVVTSEEIGKEKPSCQMFLAVLNKMNLSPENVIMIGDNFEKDVVGAVDLNIFTYWFTKNSDNTEKYKTFQNYKILLSDFQSMYDDLIELKKISKYCGERFDLVQAGGGNTSVKTINNWLVIKASGYNLTNVDTKNGYVVMDNQKLINYIESNRVNDVLIYNAIGTKRASIETFMHSILQKYTIHLHPVQINRVLVSKDARDIINKIYPNSLIIDYLTPGIQVCNKIKELYCDQKVIFLLNHGIIITSDKIQEIYEILEDILMKFEHEQQLSGFDRYKFTNNISSAIHTKFGLDNVTYLVEDSLISKYLIENKRLFDSQITFPDAVVYCGVSKLHGIKNIDTSIECPKIIIENNFVYINANTLAKCKDIQDVLKSELIILDSILDKNYLLDSEIGFLNNWDAEKYRKTV